MTQPTHITPDKIRSAMETVALQMRREGRAVKFAPIFRRLKSELEAALENKEAIDEAEAFLKELQSP